MNPNSSLVERPTIEPKWLFPLMDMVLVALAFGLAYVIRYNLQVFRPVFDPSRAEFVPYLPYMAFYALMVYLVFTGNGLYKHYRGRPLMEEVTIIINGTGNATVVLLALFFVLQPTVTSRLMLVYLAALTVLLLSTARVIRRIVWAYLRGKGIGVQQVLIIGMGETGQAILRTMLARTELGYKVIGYLDDNPMKGDVALGRVPGLGGLDNLAQVIKSSHVDQVVITLRWKHYHRVIELVRLCRNRGIEVRIVPDIFQLNMRQVQVENLDGIPLLGIEGHESFRGTNRIFKRVLDMGLIFISAPLWLVVMAIVAAAIKLDSRGPVLYAASRVGENGRLFKMYKFRTMVPNADEMRQALIEAYDQDPKHPKILDDPRVTRTGRFLRRTSIDELPNLFNVMKGQMSLVGPRPAMPDEVALYEAWHRQRLQIIPGMTGLWQVSGRSDVPFDEMCLLDIYYIENWSLRMDMQILLMTVPHVLLRRGAY